MRGFKYIGGNRAGRVENIDSAFLLDVSRALAEGAPVYVRMSPDQPDWFVEALEEMGCPTVVDHGLRQQALLIEEVTSA